MSNTKLDIKKFFINEQEYYSTDNFTLLDVLQYLNFNTSLSVVEYNGYIITKKSWKNIIIKDLDQIEIVTIVGGG
jgi:thiamine biosynthesis protein ThiS